MIEDPPRPQPQWDSRTHEENEEAVQDQYTQPINLSSHFVSAAQGKLTIVEAKDRAAAARQLNIVQPLSAANQALALAAGIQQQPIINIIPVTQNN